MSVSEQELFGLMAVAQEQQQAAAVALERLEAQRAELNQTIEQARAAVREMEMAGKASALIIEKALPYQRLLAAPWWPFVTRQ